MTDPRDAMQAAVEALEDARNAYEAWGVGTRKIDAALSLLRAALEAREEPAGTPSAQWRAKGEPDPHGSHYECERAALAMGNLTDDELANGVFLHGDGTHGRAPIEDVVAGRAFWPIAWLTAAKDRIRWLSRKLEEAAASPVAAPVEARKPSDETIRAELRPMGFDPGRAICQQWPLVFDLVRRFAAADTQLTSPRPSEPGFPQQALDVPSGQEDS